MEPTPVLERRCFSRREANGERQRENVLGGYLETSTGLATVSMIPMIKLPRLVPTYQDCKECLGKGYLYADRLCTTCVERFLKDVILAPKEVKEPTIVNNSVQRMGTGITTDDLSERIAEIIDKRMDQAVEQLKKYIDRELAKQLPLPNPYIPPMPPMTPIPTWPPYVPARPTYPWYPNTYKEPWNNDTRWEITCTTGDGTTTKWQPQDD